MTAPAIITLIRDELDNPLRPLPAVIPDETTLADLGADPLDLIVIAMAVEDECGIELHDRDVTAETTVGELCALVAREMEKTI